MSPVASQAGLPVESPAGALAAALLASLSRPAWWVLALAAFLVRGGVLIVLLPIVQLPTAAGLANAFGPALVGFVFGGPSVSFLIAVGTIATATLAWVVAGGLLGGSLDLVLVRGAAADEEMEDRPRPRSGDAGRAFAVRIVAHMPTVMVLGWGSVRLVDAAYQELIRPGDPALPVAVRVALRIPEIVVGLAAAWTLGEALGGLAVRHLAWGASLPGALVRAVRSLARPSGVATFVVTNGALAFVIFATATAVGIAWNHLRVVLVDGGTGAQIRVALILFSLTWTAGLWLLSLAVAWRATAWTFEVARHLPVRIPGTGTGTPRGAFPDRHDLAP
ncbi:MAG: hypothetical protein C0498_08380 [Anaerolinea sp.]|nr:hypothetical protein [Anaerolinea sp.]